MDAPMLPELPFITECKGCRDFYWLSDAEIVGEYDRLECLDYILGEGDVSFPLDPRPEATWLGALTGEVIAKALRAGAAISRDKELYLRIRLWWAIINVFRESYRGGGSKVQLTHTVDDRFYEATKNLERLLDLLDVEDPQERIMKAEVAMDLGRFDKALAILEYYFSPE